MALHIVAMGGGGFSMEPENPLLDDFVLGLTDKARPRVCFIATASGDSDAYIANFYRAFHDARADASHLPLFQRDGRDVRQFLLSQDVIYVGGGNTFNLLLLWRAHGVHTTLREAYRRGIVLAGISAGANCWFDACVTDSFGPLAALHDGLGLVRGSCCPHYDGEADRRPAYHRLIQQGLPPGIALEDGAAAHFQNGELREVVCSRPGAAGYRVDLVGDSVQEQRLEGRYLAHAG